MLCLSAILFFSGQVSVKHVTQDYFFFFGC